MYKQSKTTWIDVKPISMCESTLTVLALYWYDVDPCTFALHIKQFHFFSNYKAFLYLVNTLCITSA